MKTLILPNDLPSDPTTEQTPLFQKLAGHYTNIITSNSNLTTALDALEKKFSGKCTATCMTETDLLALQQARTALGR